MSPLRYPSSPHSRRHGPRGYQNVESYRPWLRDEFGSSGDNTCVFARAWLRREIESSDPDSSPLAPEI